MGVLVSRTSLLSGASALALSAFSVVSSISAVAADYHIPGDPATAKTLTGTDTLTIDSGSSISVSGIAVTWQGPSTDVVVNNYGSIVSTAGRAIDTDNTSANTPRSITINNYLDATISSEDDTFRIRKPLGTGTVTINNGGTFSSTSGQVFDFASSTGAEGTVEIHNEAKGIIRALDNDAIRPGLGTILIENSGLIEASERAINIEDGDLTNLVSFKVYNYEGGEITGLADDAIRITAGDDYESSLTTTAAKILVDNAGTISGTGGQAIDFNDLSSSAATIEIINRTTGVISSTGADAIRPGEAATVTNYGEIYAGGVIGSGDSSAAIDLQAHAGTIYNMETGEISGFRHGITTDNDVTVYNWGKITGRNGSGVGSDGDGTVINYGTITGAYAGVGNGDGDGVDIDYTGYIENYGTIQGTGAGGVDSGGNANHSEGIAMGAGVIKNYAGAIISGYDRGILIDDGSGNSAYGSVEITNAGTIVGYAGDAITVVGDYDDLLINSGKIIGNVDLGGGTNILDNKAGGLLEVGTMLSVGAGNTVNNDGTISPGGTGTVESTALTGGLKQSATGTLAIDLDAAAGTSDRVDVSEGADLDGAVKLSVAGPAIAGGTSTVLTAADGVTLTGLELIASPALQAFLIYPDANTVQVSYNLSFAPNIGLTQNETAVGEHLNDAVDADPTKLDEITSALLAVTSDGEYRSALDQLSPEIYGDSAVSTLYGAHAFGNSLLSCHKRDAQFAAVSEDECLWAAFTGRTLDQNASAQGLGYDEQTWGFSGGGQVAVAPGLMLGLAGGIEQGNADATNGASADIDRAYAGLALKHVAGPWVVAGAVFGGTGSTDTTRPINFGGLVTTATGDQTVSHLSGRLRVAYQMGGNALYAKPMIDVEATHLWIGSVQEQGGSGALSIASSEETVFSASPAVEIGGEVMIDGGTLVRPFARLGGVFYSEDHVTITSSFIGGPAGVPGFATQAEVEDVMGNVGAGLDLVWRDGTTIKAQYDGLFGSEVQQHTFGAKASVKF